MNTITSEVTSLELSKKLKEIGVKQNAFWSWYEATDRDDVPRLNRSDEHCSVCTLPQQSFEEKYSAFLASELGRILPQDVWVGKTRYCIFYERWSDGEWLVNYCPFFDYRVENRESRLIPENQASYENEEMCIANTEADARALMLIWLIKQDLFTPQKEKEEIK